MRQQMKQLALDLTSIQRLARTFDTSVESTAIRFTDFLPFPAVLSKWSVASGQLTHSWSHSNSRCRPFRYGMPKGNKAKDLSESGPQRAFRSSNIVRTAEPLMRSQNSMKGERYRWVKFPTESLAIGPQDNRYVLSLSRVGETNREPEGN